MRRSRCNSQLVCLMALITGLGAAVSARADVGDPLKISNFTLFAAPRLGEVTVTYHITPKNRSADVGLQIFVHRDDITDHPQWDQVTPKTVNGMPFILSLYKGIDNTGKFTLQLPRGTYGACRILFFESPDGKSVDYTAKVYDNTMPDHLKILLGVTITSAAEPTHAPHLVISGPPEIYPASAGRWDVTVPVDVRYPTDYAVKGKGFWVMARGAPGFVQVWAAEKNAQVNSDPVDPYMRIPTRLTLKNVDTGLWNLQFGLFAQSFGEALQWLWPGLDFEVGGGDWVKFAPAERRPPRLHVKNGKFMTLDGKPYDFYSDMPEARQAAQFVQGGNFGNAISWSLKPALSKPGYFVLLQEMGCRFIRVNFNADKYTQTMYQHAVDQVVQNIWAAGLYPILAPQDLPKADTPAQRTELGLRVIKLVANKYVGMPVWIEVLNEPQEFSTWAVWKPVATSYAKAIKDIDPNAFVVVPFEAFAKDGRAAAADPLPSDLVDLYDGHAYVKPGQVQTLYGGAIKAGLPVLIGEVGGDAAYLTQMVPAIQALTPPPLAFAPWAFTIKDQDALPLILDGSTAVLRYTPAGKVIADAYSAWDKGKKVKNPAY